MRLPFERPAQRMPREIFDMDNSILPMACSLTDSELRERRNTVLQKAGRKALEVREIENGYAYRFPSDDDSLMEITSLVSLERKCCPFLQFRITVEAGSGDLWLELSGAEGTKEFLASFLH